MAVKPPKNVNDYKEKKEVKKMFNHLGMFENFIVLGVIIVFVISIFSYIIMQKIEDKIDEIRTNKKIIRKEMRKK